MTAPSTRPLTDTRERFVLWCAEQLQLDVQQSDQAIRLEIPADRVDALGDRPVATMATGKGHVGPAGADAHAASARGTVLSPDAVIDWLVDLLRRKATVSGGGAVHSRPKRQPESVHELSQRLFSGYQIEQGSVHLGGCTLEDRPLVRITTRRRVATGGVLRHSFWYPDGRAVSDRLIDALGLEELTRFDPPRGRAAAHAADSLDAIREAACRQGRGNADVPDDRLEWLATTMVWCKFAEGKLRFQVGDDASELRFSDWAATLQPPPFVCPESGATGFHLAATTDGRITLAEQIEPCAISGDRVLKSELAECSISGRRVLPRYLATCPVSGDRLLPDYLATCLVCRQQASPRAIDKAVCRSCRRMPRVARDDPRLERLLARHRDLDGRYAFHLAETETCWIVRATGLLRERLLVVDRQTLDVRYRASRWRATPRFKPAPIADKS